jgi:pyruvate kinase
MVGGLIDAGMDVARLNFSHGSHEMMMGLVRTVRSEAKRDRSIAISELRDPRSRRHLRAARQLIGAEFTITTRNVPGDQHIVSTVYQNLPRDVSPGDTILDDGYLHLQVTAIDGEDMRTRWSPAAS